jgi:hypothetical protein
MWMILVQMSVLSIIIGRGAMNAKRVYGIEKLWISIGGK